MDRERALALYDEGNAAMVRRDLKTAVAKLSESVAMLPTAPSVAALGESLLGLSRNGEAVVHLSAALQMGAGGSRVRMLLALALVRVGERQDAISELRRAVAEQPDDHESRVELQRLLADPEAVARTANRHRLLLELRAAVPDLPPFGAAERPIDVLQSISRYVAVSIEIGRTDDDLMAMFIFLNRLAVSPDQELADLLAGAVFPGLAEWPATIALARRLLVGKGRAGFDDALALWGDPEPDKPLLDATTLRYAYRMFLPPSLIDRRSTTVESGAAFGRLIVERILGGAPDEELGDVFRLLSRMGTPRNPEKLGWVDDVYEAFERAIREILDSLQRRAHQAALRLLTGPALATFERLL